MRLLRVPLKSETREETPNQSFEVEVPAGNEQEIVCSDHLASATPVDVSFASTATSPIISLKPERQLSSSRSNIPAAGVLERLERPTAVRAQSLSRSLQMRVVAASNLPIAKGIGMWSCFCTLRAGKQERRTKFCYGNGGSDLGWSDECLSISVFDRSQLLTICLMSYDGETCSELGKAKLTPAMMASRGKPNGQGCTNGDPVEALQTSRWISLLGPNGRILYGRDGKRYPIMQSKHLSFH